MNIQLCQCCMLVAELVSFLRPLSDRLLSSSFTSRRLRVGFWHNKQNPAVQGKYLVVAGLKGLNGQLEFISAEDMEVLNAAEHFLASELEWDPTGRYVATAVTAMQQMENGLNMWLFNGQLLYRCTSASLEPTLN